MNPAQIVTQAGLEGVRLALSGSGAIKAMGDQADVDRWIPALREHKAAIVALLTQAANDVAAPLPTLATITDEPESKGVVKHRPLPTAPDTDDRITCRQCQNLSYSGVCNIAYPGGPVSAIRGYRPISTQLQRCTSHKSKGLPHESLT